jgi:hypothetical protein
VTANLSPGAFDLTRDDATYWDSVTHRVMWLRDGQLEKVQDIAVDLVQDIPAGLIADQSQARLRVFDDRSFIVSIGGKLILFTAAGATTTVDLKALDPVGVDGVGLDDYWYSYQQATGDAKVCHHLTTVAADACTPVHSQQTGGGDVFVTDDGTVYAIPSDSKLYTLSNGQLSMVAGTGARAVVAHRSGNVLWANIEDEPATATLTVQIVGGHATPIPVDTRIVIGSADDYFYETVEQDPSAFNPSCLTTFQDSDCSTGGFRWTQTVYYHFSGGKPQELGHENCSAADMTSCFGGGGSALSVQGSTLFIVGGTLRKLSE